MNLATILEKAAETHPFRRSVISCKSKVSYAQLNHLSNQLASYLIKNRHLKKASKIAILHENSINYLIALFAVAKAAMVSVPINIFFKPDEIIYMLNNCEVEILISSYKFKDILDEIKKKADKLKVVILTDKKSKKLFVFE